MEGYARRVTQIHCVKRKEGDKGLISVKNASEKKKIVQDSMLLLGLSAAGTINTRETITSVEFKKQKTKELKEKQSKKRMHGKFIRETTGKVNKKIKWQWL